MNKLKSFWSRLNKKPESREEQKKQIKISLLIVAILLVVLFFIFVFPNLLPKEKPSGTRDVVLPKAEETAEKKVDESSDKYGQSYVRTDLASFGCSLYLPRGWSVDSDVNNSVIYVSGKVKYKDDKGLPKEGKVDLCIASTGISEIKKGALDENFKYFLMGNFNYHNGASKFKITEMKETSSEECYDTKTKVYVDSSNLDDYRFSTIKEDIDERFRKEENKYLGTHKKYKLDMIEDDGFGNYNSAHPTNDFYYTYSGHSTAIMISALGAKNYADQVSEIGKTMMYSLQPISEQDSRASANMVPFNSKRTFGNLEFLSAGSATGVSGKGMVFTLSDNYKLPEYGIKITVIKQFLESDEADTSVFNKAIIRDAFASQFDYKLSVDWSKEENNVATSPTDERDVVVDGINCRQIDYLSSLKYNNKNITEQTTKRMPISNTITFIKDPNGKSLYAVNISYAPGQEELAKKYNSVFLSNIKI